MRPISSFAGSTLQCLQPSMLKQEYELRAGDELVGTIRFPNVFKRKADVMSADGQWTIEEKGIFTQRLSVTRPGGENPVTVLPFGAFRDNKIHLTGSKVVRLKRNFWKQEYTLTTDMNLPVLQVKERGGLKSSFDLILDGRAETVQEFPWLIFLVLNIALFNGRRRGGH
jgi:hypothetical protein